MNLNNVSVVDIKDKATDVNRETKNSEYLEGFFQQTPGRWLDKEITYSGNEDTHKLLVTIQQLMSPYLDMPLTISNPTRQTKAVNSLEHTALIQKIVGVSANELGVYIENPSVKKLYGDALVEGGFVNYLTDSTDPKIKLLRENKDHRMAYTNAFFNFNLNWAPNPGATNAFSCATICYLCTVDSMRKRDVRVEAFPVPPIFYCLEGRDLDKNDMEEERKDARKDDPKRLKITLYPRFLVAVKKDGENEKNRLERENKTVISADAALCTILRDQTLNKQQLTDVLYYLDYLALIIAPFTVYPFGDFGPWASAALTYFNTIISHLRMRKENTRPTLFSNLTKEAKDESTFKEDQMEKYRFNKGVFWTIRYKGNYVPMEKGPKGKFWIHSIEKFAVCNGLEGKPQSEYEDLYREAEEETLRLGAAKRPAKNLKKVVVSREPSPNRGKSRNGSRTSNRSRAPSERRSRSPYIEQPYYGPGMGHGYEERPGRYYNQAPSRGGFRGRGRGRGYRGRN